MSMVAEHRESEIAVRLRDRLGTDPNALPTTGAEFALTDHANLQLALDAVLSDAELVGFTTRHMGFGSIGLAEILAGRGRPDRSRRVRCATSTWRSATPGRPVRGLRAVLVRPRGCADGAGARPWRRSSDATLDAEARRRLAHARGGLRTTARVARGDSRAQRFRGRIISLHEQEHAVRVHFHAVPAVEREGVILPGGRSSGSSVTRSGSARALGGCGPRAVISSAGCCYTARPAPERHSRRCTCCTRWPAARRLS